ncbi:Mediator of DNA damage checkpoint protein 1, partial [Nowakowskiella sp. JEL0078]
TKILESLGGIVVHDYTECTHLVTDRVKRTVKFLCAISTGKSIVEVKWLEASKKEGRFIGRTFQFIL